ncbi:helix-turn-helix domain-containing protein [Zafaria sp. Z1313]|uniref:helix-turn-helix domain-containing protein n=1 Tax=unclassified Zafaria TaxID=2828765 RepID=UPI002E7A5CE6|nr:helix-turn-helix domain-containing protein [Zafaria sp. J156]MEE1619859.1 helix-turn-helix domain-containing protein [Zafaria sp. J156]
MSTPTTQASELVTTDPQSIRALAHPTRLALLDHLDSVEQATATECAEAIGESVASCSFHLRSLAQHGYIVPGERRGREKPWKTPTTSRTQSIDPDAPGSVHAVSALAALSVQRQAERLRDYLRQAPSLPTSDVDLAGFLSSTFYATPEEMRQLRDEIQQAIDRFQGRVRNPEARPAGARKAHLFAALNLAPQAEPAGFETGLL